MHLSIPLKKNTRINLKKKTHKLWYMCLFFKTNFLS
jgi:hypothetical protein